MKMTYWWSIDVWWSDEYLTVSSNSLHISGLGMLSYHEILSLTYFRTIGSQHGTNIGLDIDILFALPVGDRPIIIFLKVIMK